MCLIQHDKIKQVVLSSVEAPNSLLADLLELSQAEVNRVEMHRLPLEDLPTSSRQVRTSIHSEDYSVIFVLKLVHDLIEDDARVPHRKHLLHKDVDSR